MITVDDQHLFLSPVVALGWLDLETQRDRGKAQYLGPARWLGDVVPKP